MKECKVEGCTGEYLAKGYCGKHYYQIQRHGKILERTIYDPNEFVFENDICKIKLYNCKCEEVAEAIIDVGDYEKCKGRKWGIDKRGYVVNNREGHVKLHHTVLGRKEVTDHRDGDKLNNRRGNLRPCTYAGNNRNSKIPKNNTSGYKGVSQRTGSKLWVARIRYNYKNIYLGNFTDKIQAALAYNEAAVKYHGEFARLNAV